MNKHQKKINKYTKEMVNVKNNVIAGITNHKKERKKLRKRTSSTNNLRGI